MDQARILVTGATGLTGRAVIAQLHAMGVPSRALVRSISKAKSSGIESLGASLVEGDLSDSVSLAY